jgi:hypothetical protein
MVPAAIARGKNLTAQEQSQGMENPMWVARLDLAPGAMQFRPIAYCIGPGLRPFAS